VASILDFFKPAPAPEAKAVTGPGVTSLMYGTPIHSMSRNANRLMVEAQALFHTNTWVNAAERAIVGRFTRMEWHLEDENGDTVDETSPEPYQAVLNLLERPNKSKTRRQLWGITLRHNGLAGNAAWLLDRRDRLAGAPLELLYINPARLLPQVDAGQNIVGWILDGPDNIVTAGWGAPAVPLDKEEVLHFTLDEPDWGVWGIGVAEAAQRKIELDRLTDSHVGGVLGSGGRLSGLIAPKEGVTVNDDQWKQFVNDYRRITEDPEAAKRLQIAKMPLDFTQMTASPKDLQLMDVSKGNRDDILAAWGVPPSQIGIMAARGLNSGETVKYEEAALWQGAIEPRAEAFREKLQTGLLDRFADLGVRVTLVFDYPSFDDEAPLYENASKAKLIPLTNDERRAIVGLDPLEDEEIGKLIYIASEMALLTGEAPEPVVPFGGPEVQPNVPTTTDDETEVVEGKANLKPLLGLRHKMEVAWEPKIRQAVLDVLTEQRRFIGSKLPHIVAKPKDTSWWNDKREQRRFMVALEPLIEDLAAEVAGGTARLAKKPGKADSLQAIIDYVRAQVGKRITGINATTRERVQAAVAEGVEKGLGPQELGALLRESSAFDEARAEMIARTETAYAYNDSAIQSYRSLDVEEVQVIDGDQDAECAHADGATWTMDEALSNPIAHPNCTRDFIPVVKAVVEPNPMLVLAESMKAYIDRPQPEPVVNITNPITVAAAKAPDVTVHPPAVHNHYTQEPPVVTVNVPEPQVTVNVPESKAALPAEVVITKMPNRIHHAIRDSEGKIEGSMEGDA
jgi:HK97 family phage portal protein